MRIPEKGSFSYTLYELFVLNPNVPVDTRPLQHTLGYVRFFRRFYATRARYGWDIQKVNPNKPDGLFVYRPDADSPAKVTTKVALPDPSQLSIKTADYWWHCAQEKLNRAFERLREQHGHHAPTASYCFIELSLPILPPSEGGPIPIDPTAEVVFSAD